MAITVNQGNINPTRKLSAATIAVAVLAIVKVVADAMFPGRFDMSFWLAIDPVAVFVVGWFVADEPNVSVVDTSPEYDNETPAS